MDNKNNQDEVLTEKKDEELTLTKFKFSRSSSFSREVSGGGDFSIVNNRNGRRIVLSKKVLEILGKPETVQFCYTEREIVFGSLINEQTHSFKINYSGSKGIIYSRELVDEITENFSLDFSKRTMYTFSKAKLKTIDDKLLAMISIP